MLTKKIVPFIEYNHTVYVPSNKLVTPDNRHWCYLRYRILIKVIGDKFLDQLCSKVKGQHILLTRPSEGILQN